MTRDKGEGYCFECKTHFSIDMLVDPCPYCEQEYVVERIVKEA